MSSNQFLQIWGLGNIKGHRSPTLNRPWGGL